MKDEEFNRARVMELHDRAVKGKNGEYSAFFSYSELFQIKANLPSNVWKSAILYGGYEEAERKCFFFFHSIEENPQSLMDEVIHCYYISCKNPKYASNLTHSSILGALMGLGIKREMLGDILVKEKEAIVFALARIEADILNVETIGKDAVKVERISYEDSPLQREYEEKRITYETNRLDAIASDIFHLSRSEAKQAIEQGLIFLTSSISPKPSSKVMPFDHISMKGKGKAIFIEETGVSKKGKISAIIRVPK